MDNTLQDLHKSSEHTKAEFINCFIIKFKINTLKHAYVDRCKVPIFLFLFLSIFKIFKRALMSSRYSSYSRCYPMSCSFYVCRQLFHYCFFTKHVQFSPFSLVLPKQLSKHHLVLSVSDLPGLSYHDDILSDITNIFQRWSTLY